MRKFLLFGFSLVAGVVLVNSCNKDNENPFVPKPVENVFEDAVPTGYYSYAEITVPAGTESVYIEYTYQDGSTRTIQQAVSPIVAEPENGKDVEPFGTVKLLFEAENASKVSVYYNITEATKAEGDESVYALSDFPVDQITSGAFGKTRYVQVQWNFAWENSKATNWQNTKTYPKDVVFYDAEHNHTLRYTFVYGGDNAVAPEGYVLTDAYEVKDHVAIATKYDYCGGCGNCPRCMPWGCDCGCGGWIGNVPVFKANPNFTPSGDTTASAGDATVVDTTTPGTTPTADGTGEVTVDANGTIIVDYAPTDVTIVNLPEPASYVTTSDDMTFYHSSGTVMFDDAWPKLPSDLNGTGTGFSSDYNDLVVDYDIEAETVPDSQLMEEGWREQVKVVLHIRAIGGNDAWRAGLILENFNMDFVDWVEDFKTLDSYQNDHGTLPVWTETTLQENSLHYDPFAEQYRTNTSTRASIEVGGLQRLCAEDGSWSKTSGLNAGNETYIYKNGGQESEHVFNPARKLYDAWGGPHTDQYDEVMAAVTKPNTLAQIQNYKFYNTIPGYVNVAGGLYTYTVIYHMRERGSMEPEESQMCLRNMIDAVVNTTAQNFYMVKKDNSAVGLKGYEPLDYKVKNCDSFKKKYEQILADPDKNADLDPSTYYQAKNGQVWAFKCPTLTRHAWEKQCFEKAYPLYDGWVTSNGKQNAHWYKLENANISYLSCEW